MIFTVGGAGVAFIGIVYASLPERTYKFWHAYSLISTLVYVIVVIIGTIISNRFLISFEFMTFFCLIGGGILFIQVIGQLRSGGNPIILKIGGTWLLVVAVIVCYYIALLSGFASRLWAQGIWFNENDVLHVLMIAWILLMYKLLGKSLVDKKQEIIKKLENSEDQTAN
jgi:hypothetical protein